MKKAGAAIYKDDQTGKYHHLTTERLKHLYSNQKSGYIANVVNGSILAAVHWHTAKTWALSIWLGALLLITAGRSFMVWQYHHRDKQAEQIAIWRSLFMAGILASGLTWGAAGILLYTSASIGLQMFTAFVIGGMVAGASATFCAFPSIFLAFAISAMLPVMIISFSYDDPIHLAMGLTIVLFTILMYATCLRNHKTTVTSMRLHFQNRDLVEYLSQAKEKAEAANQQLQSEIKTREQVERELESHQRELASMVEDRTAELRERNRELQSEVQMRCSIEAALRDSEDRYRRLVENSIVGIFLVREYKIVFANGFMASLAGIPREKLIGSSFLDYVHPDDREKVVAQHVHRLNGNPLTEPYSVRVVGAQEEVYWLEVNAMLMPHESQPTVLVFCRDITRQRRLEMQLFQSEKMASIGQLAAGVAHEINNPVGFVNSNLHSLGDYQQDIEKLIQKYRETLGMAKSLASPDGSDAIRREIDAVERLEAEVDIDFLMEDWHQLIQESQEGTNRIKNIVSDLKSFAHPGNQDRQLTSVNACIESTLNIVWNELKYNATVVKEFGQIPDLECYPQQINQVFMNLLVNAGQAISDKGEIRIQTRQNNGHVQILISDTGCGIAAGDLGKIFDPFFTTKPVGKGTGLGLNVSYNIIKKHGGDILVSSEVGKGTTFTVQLPIDPHFESETPENA